MPVYLLPCKYKWENGHNPFSGLGLTPLQRAFDLDINVTRIPYEINTKYSSFSSMVMTCGVNNPGNTASHLYTVFPFLMYNLLSVYKPTKA